jgi:glutamate formiminotransferase
VGELGSGSRVLDVHSDRDHNRSVVTLAAASAEELGEELMDRLAAAVRLIDLTSHAGLHPRVGAADVVPIVPLGEATMDQAVDAARGLGRRIWRDLGIPVFFYGEARSGRRLVEIRRGGLLPDLGGPELHPTAGAVCVGARPPLVAYNIAFSRLDRPRAAAVVRRLRELPGVQALAFPLDAGRVQLSMNLTRLEATGVRAAYETASRLAGEAGAPELVGLCPAAAAGPGCDGGLLEARLAAAAARRAAELAHRRGGDELEKLAGRFIAEAGSMAALPASQEAVLGGAERAAALLRVLRAGGLGDQEAESFLALAARGLRRALSQQAEAGFARRLLLLDRWLAES